MLANLSVDKFLADKPLALTVSGLEELKGHILGRLTAFDTNPAAAIQAFAAERQQAARPRGSAVGVIPIRGTISQHAAGDISAMLFGGATTEGISAQLREFMADDSIRSIVLDIDSPGGSVNGITELASEIYKASSDKPIFAIANAGAYSAAYWLGASARGGFYATPSGGVGSIGVISVHQDISKMAENEGVKTTLITAGKHKAAGNPFEPLPDDTRARVQSRVDDLYSLFIHDVARGRGVSEAAVRNGYGEGDVLTAKHAQAEGMVDGIKTFEQVVQLASQATRKALGGGEAAESLGLTFSDEAEQVLASLTAFMERTASLADRRAEDGRELSAERREQVYAIVTDAKAAIDRVEQSVSKPRDEVGEARLAAMRLRLFQSRAALAVVEG